MGEGEGTAPVVLVTGSGSGIGRATAAAYLRRGAVVVGFDVAEEQPDPVPAGEVGAGGAWHPHRVDVADETSVRAAGEQVLERHGRVDVLVNSAAIGVHQDFLEIDRATWDRVMAINVTGAVLCAQAVLPSMVERGAGSVVVVSSIAARTKSLANGAHYTASKYALVGIVRHLAAELAGTGVRVNCVAPGPTSSPILTANTTEEQRAALLEKTPLHRIAEPSDVADAILFLAGEGARHVHGAVLDVNGGLY